ncbi:multipass membrane protein [Oleiphilus messinensis]|uniref:Multipass membrane protein n=1 Tax=Oleiphilus messinensis TaxID=141451 RepID=A0A1Y0I661_9GAMM|nr:DUF2804 domain-containing protein [Oleiphilus messinensis]ARU55276.1 multipass membrane protein [Oleiphilus messinensis]
MSNKLVVNGEPSFGRFSQPVGEINYLDYSYHSVMDKPLSNWRKRLKFNQFQFVGMMNPELVCGVAIVDLKYVSNAFVYLYDFKRKKLTECSFLSPLALGTSMPLTPDAGAASYQKSGCQFAMIADVESGQRQIAVQADQIKIQAILYPGRGYQPLRVCSRAGYNGWSYTQKAAGMPVEGEIRLGDDVYRLSPDTAFGSSDWSAGYMRRETSWNWACLSGLTETGEKVGLNLAAGVNETGVTENGLWLNGRLIDLGLATFEFQRKDPMRTWRISTTDGNLDLIFEPEGVRKEKIDMWLVASNFKQMFGRYSGEVKSGRKSYRLNGVPGFAEDHFARW